MYGAFLFYWVVYTEVRLGGADLFFWRVENLFEDTLCTVCETWVQTYLSDRYVPSSSTIQSIL